MNTRDSCIHRNLNGNPVVRDVRLIGRASNVKVVTVRETADLRRIEPVFTLIEVIEVCRATNEPIERLLS